MTWTERLFGWWARRQDAQCVLFVMLTVIAGCGYLHPQWITDWWTAPAETLSSASVTPVALQAQPAAGPGRARGDAEPFRVAEGECILVVIADQAAGEDSGEGIFTSANLKAIYRVAGRLEELPQVERILWLDKIPTFNLFGFAGNVLPSENASPRQLAQGRERVLSNPLAVGQLISPDAQTLVFHITIRWSRVTKDAMVTEALTAAARDAARDVEGANLRFLLTGRLPLDVMMANQHVRNSLQYQAIGYSIMIIAALVLFRGLAAVTIVSLAPAAGVFWTMGILQLTDFKDNPFNDIIVPVLISMVGLADAVHLMVEIRKQREGGLTARDAAIRGISRVGTACLLTSVTTAIGFISLQQAEHPFVQEFGWCCTMGVAMTFLSVLTVVPLGCSSPLGRRLHRGGKRSLVDHRMRHIGGLVSWVLRHDRAMSVFAILITAVLAAIALRLIPDERRYSGLSERGEAARGLRHLDQALGGLEFSSVSIAWSPGTEQADVLRVLTKVDALVRSEPLLGNPLGLQQLLAALPGDGDAADRMSMLDLLPTSLKRAFYEPEARVAAVQFRIQDKGIAAYDPPLTRVEAGLELLAEEYPNFQMGLQGNAVSRWQNQYRVVRDLQASLGTAIIVIWIVLTLFYRSIRLGLISLVPNIFPLACTGAILVAFGQHLEMVTVCMFTICVGIAVDDTIHFLTRYAEEARAGGSPDEVIRRAFTGVGTALLMTTIVLVAGLATAIFGDSRDARLFGVMGCLTLISALVADLFLLPALLLRFHGGRPQRDRTDANDDAGFAGADSSSVQSENDAS